MALKSEQARVLKRRVLGGLVRNLVLFTVAFTLVCAVVDNYMVPGIADYVANSTSVWRALDSSAEFDQALADEGLLDNGLFKEAADEMADFGYSIGVGTHEEIQVELDDLSAAIQEYAGVWAEDPEEVKKSAQKYLETADDAVSTAIYDAANAAALGIDEAEDLDISSLNDEADSARATDALPAEADEGQTASVPFISYQQVLEAEGVPAEEASAAESMAALRVSASIQELQLTIALPEGVAADPIAVLTSAALMGYDQAELNERIASAYRMSQEMAYNTWMSLDAAEEARTLGVSNDHPVWQIIMDDEGTYQIRDIATYSLIKSFKVPLAILVLVAGVLAIVFQALNRSLRYFDDLSGAVATLLADKDAPIELPPDLSIARNELAVIRNQSLADERAAHAAEQRKNELVAYLAHDVRTPLTSVLGYLDLLRETTDLPRDTLRRYADIAYSKAERLEGLINEFFEITRYNLSAIPIERETVGVRLFCQQVAESFFPEASARNIRITVDAGGTEQFFIDPDKLARALGNVMRNAVAYADPNSVIAIAARQDARNTTITVANRGREISAAHLETIFEKFYREDGARSSRSGGAGLGLAIAREIVVAHHGGITAASEGGVTVFTITVPTRGERGEAAGALDAGAGGTGALPARARQPRRPVAGASGAPRINPRNARHGQRAPGRPLRDNGPTTRTRNQRRNS